MADAAALPDELRPPPIRVARVFWDWENVPCPRNLDVSVMMSRLHDTLRSTLYLELDNSIKVYLRSSQSESSRTKVEALQDLGCECIDPHKARKKAEVVDTRIVGDMAAFALTRVKEQRPSAAVLISGDQDFAHIVNILRNHRIDVIVIGATVVPRRLVSAATTTMLLADIIAVGEDPGLGSDDAEGGADAGAGGAGGGVRVDPGGAAGSGPEAASDGALLQVPGAAGEAGGGRLRSLSLSSTAEDRSVEELNSLTGDTRAMYLLRIVDRAVGPAGQMLVSRLGAEFHEKHTKFILQAAKRKAAFKEAKKFAMKKKLLEQHGHAPAHFVSLTDSGRAWLDAEDVEAAAPAPPQAASADTGRAPTFAAVGSSASADDPGASGEPTTTADVAAAVNKDEAIILNIVSALASTTTGRAHLGQVATQFYDRTDISELGARKQALKKAVGSLERSDKLRRFDTHYLQRV